MEKSITMERVKLDFEDSCAVVTLSHPEKRNALSSEMITEILQSFKKAQDAKVRTLILRAEPGCKVWSAGHDVSELPESGRDPLGWNDTLRVLVRAIEEFPAPVIALLEGGVWGGACELALACDIVIATPDVTFAITPARLGIPYNVTGLLTFMNVVSFHVAKEMAFTAQPMSAEQGRNLGFVNHIVPHMEITSFCLSMAAEIAKLSPMSIRVMKEEMRILASAHSLTPRMFERVEGLRREVYDSPDYTEGLRAFREKRPPVFRGG